MHPMSTEFFKESWPVPALQSPFCRLRYVSPKFICWNLIPNILVFGDEDFARWLVHKGRIYRNGIDALIKEIPENSLTPSARQRWSEKVIVYEPWSGPSPDMESALILDFTASRIVNSFLFFISHLVYVIFLTVIWRDQDSSKLTSSKKLASWQTRNNRTFWILPEWRISPN